ncbi:MAG: GAF and ANTAR domain-containing protein [Austwickia sp.]|jgi:GAF domain-containing protein|nr:MAG: GAF and ANTAR domain-containing protein [Austwickia sp.]
MNSQVCHPWKRVPLNPKASDFADLAQRLHAQGDVEETLQSIAEMACETIRANMCGVMLVHRGNKVETAAVTDDIVRRADDLQLELGQGPCLEAIDDRTTFLIRDTCTETRWPVWCRQVADLGIRSVVSVRLFTQAGTIGSLNVYGHEPDQFDADDAVLVAIFAGHASVALAAARTESGLRQAMDGRHLIGLAQGILMERFDLSTDKAFAVLRRYSQDRNMKLRNVAAYVVESRGLPD